MKEGCSDDANESRPFMTGWNEQEDRYWRDAYATRPYYSASIGYPIYQSAYRYGYDLYHRHPGIVFDELDESEMRRGWEEFKYKTELTWERAKDAVKDAYENLFNRNDAQNSGADTRRVPENA